MSFEFKKATLDNGLTIIGEVMPDAHTTAVGYFCKVGTRDENKSIEGVSHFLEHMMFKGTDRRSADDVNREFDEIGANYNAYTNHENTVYYGQVIPEFLPRAIDLLGDMLRPSLRQEDFDMEKKVILEEIGMYADRPFWNAYETLLEKAYGDHPLGYRILGPSKTIEDLTSEQMRDYFNNRYGANNIVVSLAGKIDFEACVQQIAELNAHWTSCDYQRETTAPSVNYIDHTMTDKNVHRHYTINLYDGPSMQSQERYAGAVLANMVGDDDGSRLYWELVDTGLADEVEFSTYTQDGIGSFFGYFSCDPKRSEEIEAKFDKVILSAGKEISDDEIERAKAKFATGLTLQGESPMGRMQAMGRHWTYAPEYVSLDEALAKINAVTKDDLLAIVEQYQFSNKASVRLRPEAE